MFERASRMKYRFVTTRGNVTVEDLWDMSLTNLNDTAIHIHQQLKKSGSKSFIQEKTGKDKNLECQLDIVKHVIKVKQDEIKASENAQQNAKKKQEILEIIETKKKSSLQEISIEELEKMAKKL